jgi:hypothetical protein
MAGRSIPPSSWLLKLYSWLDDPITIQHPVNKAAAHIVAILESICFCGQFQCPHSISN